MNERSEDMRAFFAARVDGYDKHMLGIEGLADAYARVAALLPQRMHTLLDLGCGTGLELAPVFVRFPKGLAVTGIDLTPEMLSALKKKYPQKPLTLICGSYFDVDFGNNAFDAAISFETMHHFSHGEKRGLYARVRRALRPGSVYIEADFVASTQEEEAGYARRARLLNEQGVSHGFWHVDTPCAIPTQVSLLRAAGFEEVAVDRVWATTAIFAARRAL